MNKDRPRFIERAQKPTNPDAVRQSRSTAMVTLGGLLFVWAALATVMGGSGTPPVAILLGIFGIALVVGGLVIRP